MNREFLEQLNILPEAVEAILAQSAMDEDAHAQELADLRFEHALSDAIGQLHGRNVVAIRALLDLDALRAGDESGIRSALEELKKDNGYLFGETVGAAYSAGAGTAAFRRTPSQEELAHMTMPEYKAYRRQARTTYTI